MSGGFFDYKQNHIEYLVEDLERFLSRQKEFRNDKSLKENLSRYDEYDFDFQFKVKTLEKIQKTIDTLKLSARMAKRVDWLLSSDDSEESFLERWKEEGLDL